MASGTETAAGWLLSQRPGDVPADVREATKLRLPDMLGLALAASATPFGPAARGGALALSGAGQARILPWGDRTSPNAAAGLALAEQRAVGGDAYSDANLRDARIRDLARRVSWRIDETAPGAERYKGWVILRLKDGRALERVQENNHGSPADPMTPGQIRAKFADNARRALPADRIPAIVDAVDGLDRAASAAPLVDLRCAP